MMKATKNNLNAASNLNDPTILSPLAGGVYRSPVPVHFKGNSGQVKPNKGQYRFLPPSSNQHISIPLDGSEVAQFTLAVEPGPRDFDCRVGFNDSYYSSVKGVGVFYVLTPPRETAARSPEFNKQIIDRYISGSNGPDMLGPLQLESSNVSLAEISSVIDTLRNDFRQWQNRALETLFPLAYLERFEVLVGDTPVKKSLYLAVGINKAGHRVPLGLWMAGNTSAGHFWRRVMTELKNRGVQDILMLCAEPYEDLARAMEAEFPQTVVQYSVEHRVRNSLTSVPRKEQKQLAADLEPIFAAADPKSAELRLRQFEKQWSVGYPSIVQALKQDWPALIPYLGHPPEFHKIISTTDTIDTLSAALRKAIKMRASFQSDDDARLLVYLALQANAPQKPAAIKGWKEALVHFRKVFKGRL